MNQPNAQVTFLHSMALRLELDGFKHTAAAIRRLVGTTARPTPPTNQELLAHLKILCTAVGSMPAGAFPQNFRMLLADARAAIERAENQS